MPRMNRWTIAVAILAGLQLSACAQQSAQVDKIEPARVEPLEGTGLNRIVLTAKAAERLGLETAPVREERVVRERTVGGEVVQLPEIEAAASDRVWVRVRLTPTDLQSVDRRQLAQVVPLGDDDEDEEGEDLDLPAELEEREFDDLEERDGALHYAVAGRRHGLVPGQIVLVRLSLLGSGTLRKVVPYSAVLYGLDGQTWVYTSPEPLVYVRQPVSIEYIQGEWAVLLEGPPSGTQVVIAGVAELFGVETGVGK